MSGLETAIRNALERSDRTDAEIRARIYQSAREALDAGLRKQGVTDVQVVAAQRQRLEGKIREIEMEERGRVARAEAPPPVSQQPVQQQPSAQFSVDPPVAPATRIPEPHGGVLLGGQTRDAGPKPAGPTSAPALAGDLGSLGAARPERANPAPKPISEPKPADRRKGGPDDRVLDVPPERAAKPRRRRGWVSRLAVWGLCLAVLGGAAWWVYSSEIVQGVIRQASNAGSRPAAGIGAPELDPQQGFSADWAEVFVPQNMAALQPAAQARLEAVAASEGPAVRLLSATPNEAGDVAVQVPVELLREMAGKSSTVALTLQSGANRSVHLAVRCDFGSLGDCSRHRFTATQEKTDALFQVSFDRSLAPNSPGRILINTGLDGPDQPLLLYSVRILPGQ
ncbi:hypothetical protein [Rhizobium sp. LCM 4573]|uniref:hypothetical protein n=1 Tax=Rhizobium sp. LCM 4573 TaxID=1848291 RepID=UPI0008D9D7CE|nr:hypothetical protein [Rhizobium sp. LCM 4573]OHV83814.1 hypothetical protein LCM4573_05825 [Rhizobium sp. LCM 4573]